VKPIRYDDLDGLRAEITGEFGPWSDPVEVTQDMIDRFAALTGDDEWINVDVERARRESPFGGPIAHGFLT
jgi:acyl dehydratase